MEDVDGRLYVSERSIPMIGWKDKETDKYDRHIMGASRQKCTRNNTTVFGSINGIQNFKGDNNKGFNDNIGQTI